MAADLWHHLVCGLSITLYHILLFTKCVSHEQPSPSSHLRPNIIMVVADDMGYGDLASYGHPTQEWNVLDQMALEGVRLTQFYSPATFCTPSRAAILTGRLPVRIGMVGDLPVFLPGHSTGLPRSEVTVAELLKEGGYHTGIVGKWHLGINEFNSTDGYHLPDKHGFDYVGTLIPFSLETVCDETGRHRAQPRTARCFLYRDGAVVQQPLELSSLTRTLVGDAQTFLRAHHAERKKCRDNQPFFLLLSLLQPHTPMFNDPLLKHMSAQGEYGDQVAEMAWAVEQTLETVRHLRAGDNTMVVFVSDHGPHREMCDEGGSTGPFRGGKGNFYEGGLRVPAFFWWSRYIQPQPPNAVIASHIDLLPTIAHFAGIPIPGNIQLDGVSLRPVLQPELADHTHPAGSSERILFFYCSRWLTAVRYKNYKIHFREQQLVEDVDSHFQHCNSGISSADFYTDFACASHRPLEDPAVYDLVTDAGERHALPHTPTRQEVLRAVGVLVEEHIQGLVIPHEQLFNKEYLSEDLIPCCNPPYCVCNYG